eukprot:TRINITY_DN95376_c0_g1_i1.p1 TRINITY_DN95376_c0_g1~~TRINITY_DN95376_c0_g1_i1.p1  ORF type:complete len:879 (-),score=239.63 TRINITY_DN95376_c0_g1_i1:188-2797(-)
MAPKASGTPSLKTEKGLQQLNDLLATRSFVGNNSHATAEDVAQFAQISALPDQQQFPHVLRWYRHIAGLKSIYGDSLPGSKGGEGAADAAAKKNPRAAGKEKQPMVIDCKAVVVKDRRNPTGDDSIKRGAGATCMEGSSSGSRGRYYISTAINYCNGWPHMGHAYEALSSDVFARYRRLCGEDVFFMTGADEHGQKIATTAADEGMTPQAICDRYCLGFRALNQRLNISNDFYVRTTAKQHKDVARKVWETCRENGDIYLGRYEGWYLVREERFVTDQEAQEWDYKDPGSGKPLTKMSEPSFFFKLGKYQQKVISHIEDNLEFVQPSQYRGELLERLKNLELRDLSISRGTFDWGVPCPEDAVEGKPHVMYVWFDALINYYSGVDGNDKSKPNSRFWPASMHMIGKDIVWFHAVYWPAMLLSAGIPLPKSIVVHGFISGPDGRKMSKTYGNVIDPHDMLDNLPCDTVRWYLCREAPFGDDLKFSEDSLKLMHNSELCDNLGNLVNRAISLCGGAVPSSDPNLVDVPFNLEELKTECAKAYTTFQLEVAAQLTVRAAAATNKWIAVLEPWKMKDESQKELRGACLRVLLEAVYILAHFFGPFIPDAAEAIFKKVGATARPIPELSNFRNLKPGDEVKSGSILFEQLLVKKEEDPAAAKAAAKEEAKAKAKAAAKEKPKAEAKGKAKAKAAPVEIKDDPNQPLFTKLDVRVGKVVKAWHHPKAERLFVEEIDVGDPEGPRQIISGLREHYSLEEFQGRKLLAICNLVPAKLMGVYSHGMVLCAKNPEKKVVELLDVPDSLPVGTRVLPEGLDGSKWQPYPPEAVKELKVWENIVKDARTDKDRVACFQGTPLVTANGDKFLAPTQPNVELG